MKITSIINKNSNMEVCQQYLDKELYLDLCIIIVGRPLVIAYAKGSYFGHEKVVSVKYLEHETFLVETINKLWTIR